MTNITLIVKFYIFSCVSFLLRVFILQIFHVSFEPLNFDRLVANKLWATFGFIFLYIQEYSWIMSRVTFHSNWILFSICFGNAEFHHTYIYGGNTIHLPKRELLTFIKAIPVSRNYQILNLDWSVYNLLELYCICMTPLPGWGRVFYPRQNSSSPRKAPCSEFISIFSWTS